eukprot:CAMPEP_0119302962 /NCGR_PEP_ID=MMETSP1333-20130426/4472_1 /TAXON_ID=418940 /ORGANISM="Scyphosphaera apsteinii, Strain RCC1455" /LENGTH=521 /DNA_ID=CAMNT_0007305495 /DNA_START=129 /DNA_END=1696 /DNA_ORIENTATION=+
MTIGLHNSTKERKQNDYANLLHCTATTTSLLGNVLEVTLRNVFHRAELKFCQASRLRVGGRHQVPQWRLHEPLRMATTRVWESADCQKHCRIKAATLPTQGKNSSFLLPVYAPASATLANKLASGGILLKASGVLRPPPRDFGGCVGSASSPAPLITALCVSHGRPRMLERAISLWWGQEYSQLELVVLYDKVDADTREVAIQARAHAERWLRRTQHAAAAALSPNWQVSSSAPYSDRGSREQNMRRIVLVENRESHSALGHLRNLAINAASGEFVCQWDDDDIHHPLRIAMMLHALLCSRRNAVVLDAWVTVDFGRQVAYEVSEWPMEGTILARRSLLRNCYPNNITRFSTRANAEPRTSSSRLSSSRAAEMGADIAGEIGEDTICVQSLVAAGQVAMMHAPHLYMYTVHGNNTSSDAHFAAMVRAATGRRSKNTRGSGLRMLSDARYSRLITTFGKLAGVAPHSKWRPTALRSLRGEWLVSSSLCDGSDESVPMSRVALRKRQAVKYFTDQGKSTASIK